MEELMRIIEPGHRIVYPYSSEDWIRESKTIEEVGRTAYRSNENGNLIIINKENSNEKTFI